MHAPVYRFAARVGHGQRGAVLGLCFWLCVRLLPPTRDYHMPRR